MTINKEKLAEIGFKFDNEQDYIWYLERQLEFFDYHNKNLTKQQERKLNDIFSLIKCLEIAE